MPAQPRVVLFFDVPEGHRMSYNELSGIGSYSLGPTRTPNRLSLYSGMPSRNKRFVEYLSAHPAVQNIRIKYVLPGEPDWNNEADTQPLDKTVE